MVEYAAYALLLAVVVLLIIVTYSSWRDCTDSGGTMVRGIFGFECIQR